MRKLLCLFIFCCCLYQLNAQQHPAAIGTKEEWQLVKNNLSSNTIISRSYEEIKRMVDPFLGKEVDVPFPKDPAGGYTHEKHKENYTIAYHAATLYQITGKVAYGQLVKEMLLKYAALNPTLKNHPEATSSSPGRIFWQALNDANWLVYMGLAYDGVNEHLSTSEKETITKGAFKPIVDYVTKDLTSWFNLIHNHAVWACAGVGIVGIATDNEDYINMALYGTEKNGKAGFLAHLNGLFSPDGYYNEGPYYTRYAILPFYFFAKALHQAKPSLNIFQYRNKILQKALDGALQQTNLDGSFFSYNDALKDKNYTTAELVIAVDMAWQIYGDNPAYLPVAKAQGKVTLSAGGVAISNALAKAGNNVSGFPYKPIAFTDGANGNKGGVSILRMGKGKNLSTVIFKYSSHGMSHGHFDKLNINWYDQGNEILQDYGAARFIGIEQKWGGRYLPETKSYAQQSIAHNTIVVDEKSHYEGKEAESEKYSPSAKWVSLSSSALQVSAAVDSMAYPKVRMERTVYMVQVPGHAKSLILDLFNVQSPKVHQYDLPFQFLGNVLSANFTYEPSIEQQTVLGKKNGYQFLWKEAEAKINTPFVQFTFLNGKSFYTISSFVPDSTKAFFTRIGANDPNFNLRRDPAYILRSNASDALWLNVLEAHGQYSTVSEVANGAYSGVAQIKLEQNNTEYTVFNINFHKKPLILIQSKKSIDPKQKHSISVGDIKLEWIGPYAIFYNNSLIQ